MSGLREAFGGNAVDANTEEAPSSISNHPQVESHSA